MNKKIGGKGSSNYSYKHGMSKTRFYKIWLGIKKRVNADKIKRPVDYRNYVEKNITLYKDWYDFINFKEDLYADYLSASLKYGEKNITIDRVNNNKGYIPNNIRWVTRSVQNINKSNNKYLTYNNECRTLVEWSKLKKVPYSMLSSRINKLQWDESLALNRPLQESKKYKYNEKEYTLTELSKFSQVDVNALHSRLYSQKWDVKRAVETPLLGTKRNIVITIDGITKHLMDFCKDYNISYTTVLSRVSKGMSYEDALKLKVKKERTATLNNETKTIKEWCSILGINYQTVCSRISRGMSYEDALTFIKK